MMTDEQTPTEPSPDYRLEPEREKTTQRCLGVSPPLLLLPLLLPLLHSAFFDFIAACKIFLNNPIPNDVVLSLYDTKRCRLVFFFLIHIKTTSFRAVRAKTTSFWISENKTKTTPFWSRTYQNDIILIVF